jgi:hypothetical protein
MSIVVPSNEAKRSKIKESFLRQGGKSNALSLTNQIIQEISHENNSSQDEQDNFLENGHHADCNINRHRRQIQDNNSISSTAKAPQSNHQMISMIEEASV